MIGTDLEKAIFNGFLSQIKNLSYCYAFSIFNRMLQRSDPEFIKTISCVRDSYYIFLGMTIQLDDVVKMCCNYDNVLLIDTTFNLCSSWVTDCSYNNDHLTTNESKHPIILGSAMVYFEKSAFLFSRFASEMLLVTLKQSEQI